jgi:2'-5' RNA ligase
VASIDQGIGTRRLFFALWPPDSLREQILIQRDLLGPVSQRRVPVHNYHLTLLFLGNQPADRLDEILAVGDAVDGRGFELTLDHWGYFDGPAVRWLGARAPTACSDLVDALTRGARDQGLHFQPRPFVPHLTVFRRAPGLQSPQAIEPIHWPVSDFSLIESIPNRPYQVLRTWRLE